MNNRTLVLPLDADACFYNAQYNSIIEQVCDKFSLEILDFIKRVHAASSDDQLPDLSDLIIKIKDYVSTVGRVAVPEMSNNPLYLFHKEKCSKMLNENSESLELAVIHLMTYSVIRYLDYLDPSIIDLALY